MAREVAFGDQEEMKKASQGNLINRYKADVNRKDRIRILTSAYAFKMHWIDERRRYINCGIDDDGNGTCIVCQQQDGQGNLRYPVQEKYAALIMWIAKREGRGEWKPVQEVMFWGYGKDKYKQISELVDEVGPIQKHELIITCQDTQMQRLNIRTVGDDPQLDKEALEAQLDRAKNSFKIFMNPSNIERQKEALGDPGVEGGVMDSLAQFPDDGLPEAEATGSIEDEVDDFLSGLGGL